MRGRSGWAASAAAVLVVVAVSACGGQGPPRLGDYTDAGIEVDGPVESDRRFEVTVPGEEIRTTYYELYAPEDDEWVLAQVLFAATESSPAPQAQEWSTRVTYSPSGLEGPGPDLLTTLADTEPGAYILCVPLISEDDRLCAEVDVVDP